MTLKGGSSCLRKSRGWRRSIADRTRLVGGYHLGTEAGTFDHGGDYAADSAKLDPSMLAGVTQPLAAAAKTPIGPVATSIGNAVLQDRAQFQLRRPITVVNFPGGGAARIDDANIIGPGGARARVFGGSGVTYYWPSGGLRIDGDIEMAGGGLPQGRVSLRQPRAGAPMSGVADFAPYSRDRVSGSHSPRSALVPAPAARPRLARVAQLDGPFPGGRVQALRLPITGQIGRGGSFAFGTSCAVVSFNYLQMSVASARTDAAAGMPDRPGDDFQAAGGPVIASARLPSPVLNGRLGSSPLHLQAAGGRIVGQQFVFDRVGMRLGRRARRSCSMPRG